MRVSIPPSHFHVPRFTDFVRTDMPQRHQVSTFDMDRAGELSRVGFERVD